jgi:Ser/Thr protein kinase RdoA (MazF antagonist)
MVKSVPWPGSLCTSIVPPCAWTNWRTIASPRPLPPVIPGDDGSVICRHDGLAYSVWPYLDAPSGADAGLTGTQMAAMGETLGRMHRRLAQHPLSLSQPTGRLVRRWDVGRLRAELARLCRLAATRGDTDFGAWACEALTQRIAVLPAVGPIADALPALSTQVIHGDLAAPNVLLTEDGIAAVIDYQPPAVQPIAHDISRIGCDPRTVLRLESQWPGALRHLAEAYLTESPGAPLGDVVASVRWLVCYTAMSTYPLRRLIVGESPTGGSLEAYARQRHQALQSVMGSLDEVEDQLRRIHGIVR